MSHYLVQAVEATPKVQVRAATAVVGGGGDGYLQQLLLREAGTREDATVAAETLFIPIGARPQTEWLPAVIARDEHGFLRTGDDVTAEAWPLDRSPLALETSMPGVLAAGDVRHASVKRVAAAVGEGSIAIQQVQRLLTDGQLHSARAPERAFGATR
jgi:thioredoxin reductase (NADPH)